MSKPKTTLNMIFIPPNLYYEDRAHTSLAIELNILSKASDQRVAEKALSLHKSLKCKKLSEINDIIWDQSKEIADSKHAITEDSQSDNLFKKINEDDEEFLENVGLLFLYVTDEQCKKVNSLRLVAM
ncbi:15358_t:CDS:2 [Funneliformis geosporum]|nr:15358_t:CDS:2 [Funneliformis geosporum]